MLEPRHASSFLSADFFIRTRVLYERYLIQKRSIETEESGERSYLFQLLSEWADETDSRLRLQQFIANVGTLYAQQSSHRNSVIKAEHAAWHFLLLQAIRSYDSAYWETQASLIERDERCGRVDIYVAESSTRQRTYAAYALGFVTTFGAERGALCAEEATVREHLLISETLSRRSLARYLAGIVATITLHPWEETEKIRRAAIERDWLRSWNALRVNTYGILLFLVLDEEVLNRRRIETQQQRAIEVIEVRTALDRLELRVQPVRRMVEIGEMKGRCLIFHHWQRDVALRCQARLHTLRRIFHRLGEVPGAGESLTEYRPLFCSTLTPATEWFPSEGLALMPSPQLMEQLKYTLRPRAFSAPSAPSTRSRRSVRVHKVDPLAREREKERERAHGRGTRAVINKVAISALAAAGERRMRRRNGSDRGSDKSHRTARTRRPTMGGLANLTNMTGRAVRKRAGDRDSVSSGARSRRAAHRDLAAFKSFHTVRTTATNRLRRERRDTRRSRSTTVRTRHVGHDEEDEDAPRSPHPGESDTSPAATRITGARQTDSEDSDSDHGDQIAPISTTTTSLIDSAQRVESDSDSDDSEPSGGGVVPAPASVVPKPMFSQSLGVDHLMPARRAGSISPSARSGRSGLSRRSGKSSTGSNGRRPAALRPDELRLALRSVESKTAERDAQRQRAQEKEMASRQAAVVREGATMLAHRPDLAAWPPMRR